MGEEERERERKRERERAICRERHRQGWHTRHSVTAREHQQQRAAVAGNAKEGRGTSSIESACRLRLCTPAVAHLLVIGWVRCYRARSLTPKNCNWLGWPNLLLPRSLLLLLLLLLFTGWAMEPVDYLFLARHRHSLSPPSRHLGRRLRACEATANDAAMS